MPKTLKRPQPFQATTHDMAILLGEQLSENIGMTGEGYLVCKNVPVARTGVQYYYGYELGLTDYRANKQIPVYREEDAVFETAALQSIESKPITDDHPEEAVTVHNAQMLSRGHGRNARRDGKHVVCDLVITDPGLITDIQSKRKYQISLGYTCVYEPYKDGFKQTQIRVNHIAVVEAGRAGPKVAIKDKLPVKVKNRRKNLMDKNAVVLLALHALAKDSSPEDFAEQAEALLNLDAAPAKPAKTETKDAEGKGVMGLLAALLAKDAKPADKPEAVTADAIAKIVADEVAKAVKALDKKAKDTDEEEVEKMLNDEDEEEKETADADEEEEKETSDEGEEEKEEKETSDAEVKALSKALKPFYKRMSDKEKKKVKDNLVGLKKGQSNGYAGIMEIVKSYQAKDSQAGVKAVRPEDIAKKVMEKHNPHYAKKA